MSNALTRRPTMLAAAAVLLAMSAVVMVTGTHAAGAAISWSAANPPLPADAVPGQGVTLLASSCPADGWCVAVGDYLAQTPTTTYEAGLIESESGGTWTATESPLPTSAGADPQALLEAVSCPSVGSCVATGRYVDASGATQGLVEQLSNSAWSATTAVLPPGAVTAGTGEYTELTQAACTSVGSCTALGVYTPSGGPEQGLIESQSGGGGWSAIAAPLPTLASGSQFFGLSCPAAGACVATGMYEVAGIDSGLVETQSGTAWSASTLPLPAGASPEATIANDDLAVSCSSPGTCTVAGTTFDGNYEGVLDTLSGGTWKALSAPVPGGQSSPDVQLSSVSCGPLGTCEAVGLATVNGASEGLVESLSGGTWNATQAPVPAGYDPNAGIAVLNVACPTDGNCAAVGQSDDNGVVNGLIWNLSSGTWTATATPLPGDAVPGADPLFAPVTCPAVGACIAVGTYFGANGREGVVETDPSLAATTTKVSMQPVAGGDLYSATVSGSTPPTGSVVFFDGLGLLCSATVSNGSASCSGPAPVDATVVGSYSGNAVSAPSWGSAVNAGVPAAIYATGYGWMQSTIMCMLFPFTLQARVVNAAGGGIPGVEVTFTVPATADTAVVWGGNTAVSNSAGVATSNIVWASCKKGSYTVSATAPAVPGSATFFLTNAK
ncbi:MAG: hypothetical protein ABSG81_02665 [Acidimicrobiales bacterium]